MQLMGKLRKCGLEGMGWFLSDLLHKPSPCMLPSGQGTLVAPQAHGEGLVSKISTLTTAFILQVTVTQLFCYTIFFLKHITNPKWLACSATTTKCNLQEPVMPRKHQLMNLGYFIFRIMQKTRHPSYPIKSNLTIISLIHTLVFKASSIDQKQSLRAP